MKKKKVVYKGVGYCPKNGDPACCVKQGDCPGSFDPFQEIDSAVQRAWEAFSELEPSVKDIKKSFVRQLLMSYLFQCMRIGLTEDEIKLLFEEELKKHHDAVNAFREISEKMRKEKAGYDLV